MGKSSKRRSWGRRHGLPHAPHSNVSVDGPAPGTVLTIEGEDKPLDHDLTIDLATAGKLSPDGKAHFRTRQADPMRPFNKPPRADVGPVPEQNKRRIAMRAGTGDLREQAMHEHFGAPFATDLKTKHGFSRQEVLDYVLKDSVSDEAMTRRMHVMDSLAPVTADRMLGALQEVGHETGTKPKIMRGDAGAFDIRPEMQARADRLAARMDELTAPPYKLERVQESGYHKVLSAWVDKTIAVPAFRDGQAARSAESMSRIRSSLVGLVSSTGIFLLQHNWAGAFAKAQDFQGGEIKLPFPLTVFECRINHMRAALVLVALGENNKPDDLPGLLLHLEIDGTWVWCGSCAFGQDFKVHRKDSMLFEGMDDLADALLAQARAVLISLDAEVAESEVIRAPYKLNQAREKKGKLPLFDYHVVSLAARKRYGARLPSPGDRDAEHHHKRLHWVRGHYRHYENHKTWIKWHLRGDPDLGFIDKEYRL